MHVARLQPGRSVRVVDLDLAGTLSSSELNAGGVRVTWNHPLNAALSRMSIDYYETVAGEIGFLQRGYFWMHDKAHWGAARDSLQKNAALKGAAIDYLSPAEITQRFPFFDKTSDLGGATFSHKDGLLNANLLKSHYRKQAKAAGAVFQDRTWVHAARGAHSGPVEVKAWVFPAEMSEDDIRTELTARNEAEGDGLAHTLGAREETLRAKVLVNCSGPWARRFASLMGLECPCFPLRRQVSLFSCREVDLRQYGMFVDSSGVYFHPEGNDILGGFATPEETPGYNLNYDGEEFFNERIWAALFERSTKFENLKHLTGWAGLYEVSPDKSAVVGRVAPFDQVYEAHSFSGRGAMQSYAAGLALAELIAKGRFETLDLTGMDGGRFARGESVDEGLLI